MGQYKKNKFGNLYILNEMFNEAIKIGSPNSFKVEAILNERRLNIYHDNNTKLMAGFIQNLLIFLKFCQGYKYLNDIVGCDNLTKDLIEANKSNRFLVKYKLESQRLEKRIDLNSSWDDTKYIYSSKKIFYNSGWCEREIWDLFGVFFTGSDDLRRLLTDYGFSGFPFRKDFPLVGFRELQYHDEWQEIVYKKVSLDQENRFFEYDDTWYRNSKNKT